MAFIAAYWLWFISYELVKTLFLSPFWNNFIHIDTLSLVKKGLNVCVRFILDVSTLPTLYVAISIFCEMIVNVHWQRDLFSWSNLQSRLLVYFSIFGRAHFFDGRIVLHVEEFWIGLFLSAFAF